MNKKVITIVSAVLALIAGAFLVVKVPSLGILAVFLEVCAGFVCGYFFNDATVKDTITDYKREVASLTATSTALKDELTRAYAEMVSVKGATTAVNSEKKVAAKTNKSKATKTNKS